MGGSWLLTPPPIHLGSFHSKKHHQFHQTLFFKNHYISSPSLSTKRIFCNYNNNNNNDPASNTNKPERSSIQLYSEIERLVSFSTIPPYSPIICDNAKLRSRSFLRRGWWFRGAAAGWVPTKQRRRGGFAPKRLRRESKRGFRKDKD